LRLVEDGAALINCMAYIDLNPVRASIVQRPEDYRWTSLGHHIQTKNKDDFHSLDFDLKEFGALDANERLRRYRKYVYETGAVEAVKGKLLKKRAFEIEHDKELEVTRITRFKCPTRYFSDSCIIGSKTFVNDNYQRFKGLFHFKKDNIPKRVKGLDGMYSC